MQFYLGQNTGHATRRFFVQRIFYICILRSIASPRFRPPVPFEKIAKIAPGRGLSRDFEVKLKSSADPANLGLAVVVQTTGTGKIVGAASIETISSAQASNADDGHR